VGPSSRYPELQKHAMTLKFDVGGGGTDRPLRVLLVEDSEPDAQLLVHALLGGGYKVVHARVDTRETMERALNERKWDIVLADHAMPSFSAPEALTLVKDHGLDLPFIIVSGFIEEETAVAAMRAGAHDYVMKDRLARLVPAVERELREAEVRRARLAYAEALRQAREELELRVEQRTADLQAANAALRNVLAERKRLENELLEIAENERRSIGLDLHDDLGQKLTGLSMMTKGLEQKLAHEGHPCREDARAIHRLLEEIVSHTHNLAHQFSALNVQGNQDLSSVLQELAANVRRMFNISCHLTAKGPLPELPTHTLVQLQKIAQESVSNAIKHGKAEQVHIGLASRDSQVVLTIKNDGVPFSVPAAAKNRMGLRIMRYRANTIGASFDVSPIETGGTLVTCCLPGDASSDKSGERESPETRPNSEKERLQIACSSRG
jgi:signal transduction histidine kinase